MNRIILEQKFDNGVVNRCDGMCYHAKSDICTCICGGVNHGIGEEEALSNAEELAKELKEKCPDSTVETGVLK